MKAAGKYALSILLAAVCMAVPLWWLWLFVE